MPTGYVKLTCDDCGGKLVLADSWMPDYCITAPGKIDPRDKLNVIQALTMGYTPILPEGMKIETLNGKNMFECESCHTLYERTDN